MCVSAEVDVTAAPCSGSRWLLGEKNGLRRKEAAAGGALIVSPELYILIMTNVFAGVGRLSLRLIYCTLPIFFQRRTKKEPKFQFIPVKLTARN